MKRFLDFFCVVLVLINITAFIARATETIPPDKAAPAAPSIIATSSPPPLNEAALISGIRTQFEKLTSPALAQNFNPTITIKDKKFVQVDGMGFYAVALKIEGLPVKNEKGVPAVDMIIQIDPEAKYQVFDIRPLGTNVSVFAAAQRELNKVTLPEGLGYKVLQGTGKHKVVMIADPVCIFCRAEYKFLLEHKNAIDSLYLISLPLTALHPNAAIITAYFEYVMEHHPALYSKVVDFAFTESFDVSVQGLEQEIQKSIQPGPTKGADVSGRSVLEKVERSALQALVNKFPETKPADLDAFYYLLKGKYAPKVDETVAKLNETLKVNATPVTIIGDGYVVRGKDDASLSELLGIQLPKTEPLSRGVGTPAETRSGQTR